MTSPQILLLALLPSQPTTTATVTDPALRALHAMEKAAVAAEAAAEAASRAAAAVERIADPRRAEVAAETTAPGEPPPWAGTIGFGLIWLAGNAETLTLSGNLALERKTTHWIFAGKASGVYGETLIAGMNGEPQVVALAASTQLRVDRRFTPTVTGYVAGGVDTDHVKSIEYRAAGDVGSGITWFETLEGELTKSSLRTDLGFRYSRESRFQYYPTRANPEDVELIAPRLGVAFRHALSKDLSFTEDAELLPNIVGDSRFLLNSISKLSIRLTQILSFAVAAQLNHDSAPAEGKQKTDSALTLGLEVAL